MDRAVTTGESFVRAELEKSRDALNQVSGAEFVSLLTSIATRLTETLGAGGKVLLCGNGGSAADAQHLAAELVGRQNYDRAPAAGIALTVDTSALTAIGNDYGFEFVFERQVQAIGRSGDVLIGLSTSGKSKNVVRALGAAQHAGMTTVAFTGRTPADMAGADLVLPVPATETAKIQELHITCGHIIFGLVERLLFPKESS